MIATSLTVLTLAASLAPFSNLIHLHAHAATPDARITVTLRNVSPSFEDIRIDGRSYTVQAHQALTVKAPIGTVILAASSTGNLHRGDIVAALTPNLKDQSIVLR